MGGSMLTFKDYRIKHFISGFFILIIFADHYSLSFAQDATLPRLKAGDIISADILNERFNRTSPDLSSTIIGVWSAQCWDIETGDADAPGQGTLTVNSLTSITFTGVSCLARTNSNNNGAGIFSILRFKPIGNRSLITTLRDWNGVIQIKVNNILELTVNRIIVTVQNEGIEILTRVNTVPEIPTDLSASASGLTVDITWKDASNNETGFRILRKDSLGGSFNEIGTTGANTTIYRDVLPGAGQYWYRVRATNSNGDSLGSNEVMVTGK
jgi:hypothetical protein